MKKLTSLVAVILAVVATTLSVPALAADFPEGAQKPFQIELGTAWDSFDTQARLDYTRQGVVQAGATLDLEKLLNIPVMEQHFRLNGQWRFTKVSYVEFGYENIRRAGQRVIDQQITWGDATYGAGVNIDGRFYSDEVYVGYKWDAFRAENVRVGATIGFSYYDISSTLTGDATVTKPDGSTEKRFLEKGFSIAAPFPVIGLTVDGAISKDFTFGFYSRALFINTGDFSGGLIAGGLSFKWYATKNLGLGAGVDLTSLQIKKYVKDDQIFSAKYTYAGPRLFAVVAF
jgi:hypothetical protein